MTSKHKKNPLNLLLHSSLNTHAAFSCFVIEGVIWAAICSLYSVNTSRNLSGGAGGGDIPGQPDRPVARPHGAGGGHHGGLDTSNQKTEEGWDTR